MFAIVFDPIEKRIYVRKLHTMKIKFYTTLILLLGFFGSTEVFGQTIITALASGDWNVGTNWSSGTVPTSTNSDLIEIPTGIHITIPTSSTATAKRVLVRGSANLTISASGSLTIIGDGTTTADLVIEQGNRDEDIPDGLVDVYGTLSSFNGVEINSSSLRLKFNDGSTYFHNHTTSNGNIPFAEWKTGSTVFVSGYTINTVAPGNLGQTFYNFIWDNPNMDPNVNYIDLGGTLKTVNGNLMILNTGPSTLLSFSDGADYTLNIGQNLIIDGNSRVYLAYNQSSATINLNGNFENTSSRGIVFTRAAALTFNVEGNIRQNSASSLRFVTGTGAPGSVTINLKRDFNISAGTLSSSTKQVTTSFVGTTNQTLTSNGQTLYNVVAGGTGNLILNGAADFNGNLSVSSSLNANNQPLNVEGNIDFTGGTFTPGTGLLTLDGGAQNLTSAGQAFGNLSLAGTGTKTPLDPLATLGDLSINSGVTFTSNNLDHAIGGNWTNNGAFTQGTNKVTFNGAAAQTLSGTTTFYNLDILNSAATVAVQGNVQLQNLLTVGTGAQLDADGSGTGALTLLSDATRTAAIATIPSGATVSGNVIVQRYIPSGNLYRYVATPVQNATVAQWANDIAISQNTLYTWDESFYKAGVGYVPYGTHTNALKPGEGYAVSIPAGGPYTLTSVGPVQHTNNEVDFGVSYTPNNTVDDDGWNLVGNPFPSSIDVDAESGWTRAGLDAVVYIPHNTDAGLSYVTYNYAEGVDLGGGAARYIASGQAFWVKANGTATPNMIATEAVKAGSQTGASFYRKAAPQDYLIVGLQQGALRDATAILFRENTSAAFDLGRDNYKMPNAIFNLSSLTSDEKEVSFNLRPWFDCSTEVALNVSNVNAGTYTLDFTKLNTFTKNVEVLLIDHFTNSSVAVAEGTEYAFEVTEDAASKGAGRFSLLFSTEAPLVNLAVEGSTICENETEALVGLSNTETGVSYQVYKGENSVSESVEGNGSTLSLPVSAGLLENGSNELRVVATKENCESVTLIETATVIKNQLFEVTETQGASNCGVGTLSLQASGAPEGGSYSWYTSVDATSPIEGATEATFVTPELETTTTYWVSVLSAEGCESTERVAVTAEINTLTEPEISQEENLLISSYAEGNQWYLDGTLIEGATEQNYTPTSSGSYTVQVSQGECQVFSEALQFTIAGVADDLAVLGIQAYPNPTMKMLHISFDVKEAKEVRYTIYNQKGAKVDTGKITERNTGGTLNQKLDVQGLPTGMYTILLNDGKNSYTLRFIKK